MVRDIFATEQDVTGGELDAAVNLVTSLAEDDATGPGSLQYQGLAGEVLPSGIF